MKKAVLLGLFLGVVNYATAQIWSETFSTSAPPAIANGGWHNYTNERPINTWGAHRSGNRTVVNPGGRDTLRIRVNNWDNDGHAGKSEGACIALDGSSIPAGTYRLTIDFAEMHNYGWLGVSVYDASVGSGGSNNYYSGRTIVYGLGTNNPCEFQIRTNVNPINDATATLLKYVAFNSSHQYGTRSIDFVYDGTGDIGLMLSSMSEEAINNRYVEIDAISLDVATPNAFVPSFSQASYVIAPEALQNQYYSNDVSVVDATVNPGNETLYYSGGRLGGLNISSNGTIYGTPTAGGTNTMIISVADADGAYAEAVFTLIVQDENDAPVFNDAYGSNNNFWAGNALIGLPYSADLNGYVSDPDGDELTFYGSGPGWLTIETNGVFSGTPGDLDYFRNEFQIIVTDGELSSTGTLNIAVEKRNILHSESFDPGAPPFVSAINTAVFPVPDLVTTTQSNGNWYKTGSGGSGVTSNGTLRFARPDNITGGMAGMSMVFDEALFVDGAATYEIRLQVIDSSAKVSTKFYEVYNVDYGVSNGTVTVPNLDWNSPVTNMPAITLTNGAIATLLTNVSSAAQGWRTVEFDYDGTGDVLFRFGGGKKLGQDFWTTDIDNFKLVGPSLVTPLQTWAYDFGLKGAAADGANDPNGDGWPLLYDYGLGLNPTNGTPENGGATPTVEMVGSDMAYVHALRKDDPSLVYSIETNPDLTDPGGWTDGVDYVTGINVTTGAFNYVTNTIPTTDPEKFIRLKIEE